ncbi:MAG TPA: NYN domain-containing protein [Anaerolineales bacterium]|nr:NYN domain-containing protein [Anaerolineales bacterium]
MPYLIDGHNLIPKLGLRLDSMDDELELIVILQEFCRLERKKVEVFFDGAPAPHAGTRKLGAVTAHFVRLGNTADNAIRKQLKALKKSARNWTVVSSDRQVQAEARAAQAEVISSDSFAAMLKQARNSAPKSTNDKKLSQQEVDDWLKLFEERSHNKKYGG